MFGLNTGKKIENDPQKIEDVLARGVHEVFTKEELRKKLLSGKQLHFKLGTDVTGSLLHLGHAVVHRKLRDFQELGHKVTLIIGDFTTLVGDHSDKIDMRKDTTSTDIKDMEETYKEQFFKTVIKDETTIRHNSEWLSKLNFNDVINLSKQFSVAQMLDRETFAIRYKSGKTIGLDEFLYPLMQGYDSVAIKCDVELGGTDQTFNLLAGRHIMPSFGLEAQNAVVMKLLVGSDGKPMGKSLKNFIPISAEPFEMYGQIMSIVDEAIFDYFELVTRVPMEEISKMKERVSSGENPMIFKKMLAKEIVTFYHSEEKAKNAEENFGKVFSNKGVPDEVLSIKVSDDVKIADKLVEMKIVESKSDLTRLLASGAVSSMTSDKTINSVGELENPDTYKIGKRRFIKIEK